MRVLLGLAWIALVGGCIDDFDPPSLVTKNRPLGVRVAIEGDDERTWPAAGENVTVTWLMGDAAEPRPLTWGLLACPGILAPTGDTVCIDVPLGVSLVDAPTIVEAPSIAFTVPPAAALEAASIEYILVTGIICADGAVRVDVEELDATCEGADAVASRVSAAVRIAPSDEPVNRHPSIEADAVTLSGEPWTTPPTDVPLSGCASLAGGSALPSVSTSAPRDAPVEVGVQPTDGDREPIVRVDGSMGREALVYSHYCTGGELDRQFSAIDDRNSDVRVEWEPPSADAVSADGDRVRFYLLVRDGRGGVAWTIRELCVIP